MSKLLMPAFWWIVTIFLLGVCSSRASVVLLGHSAEGSLYRWSISLNPNSGGVATGITNTDGSNAVDFLVEEWPPGDPGSPPGYTRQGTFLVPVGQSRIYLESIKPTPGDPWEVGFTVTLGPGEAGPYAQKRVRIKYFNTKDYPVTLRLLDVAPPYEQVGSDYVVGKKTLFSQTITLPVGVESVKLLVRVEGVGWDGGQWIVDEEGVTEVEADPEIEGSDEPETEDVPVTDVPEPDGLPSSAVVGPESGGTVWRENTDTADVLTKPVYREGVDKIVARINSTNDKLDGIKSILTTADVPGTPTAPTEAEAVPEDYFPRAVNKIPVEIPEFITGEFGSESVITYSAPNISVSGVTLPGSTLTIDLAEYQEAVGLFRAVCSCVVWIGFFLLCVVTIRSASAGGN